MIYAGWDQSLNHGALVVFSEEGRLLGWRLLVSSESYAKSREYATSLPRSVTQSKLASAAVREQRRLVFLRDWFRQSRDWLSHLALETGDDVCLVVEDYATGAARKAHQLGEVGGQLRTVLLGEPWVWPTAGARVRLLHPQTVKKLGAGKGTADKDDMFQAAIELLDEADTHLFDGTVCHNDDTRGDLADAVCMAFIARIEHRLREGVLTMSQLTRPMREAMLHVTPNQPDPIVTRDYLTYAEVSQCYA